GEGTPGEDTPSHPPVHPSHPIIELFSANPWRKHAVIAILLGVVVIAGAGTMAYWHPNLVQAVSEGLSADAVKDRKSFATYTLHIGTLLGVLFVPWLCERLGRRQALLTFFVGALASVVVTLFGATSYERILFFGPLMTFFTIGVSGAVVLYFPELFPTRLRATGAGFGYNTARIFTAPIPILTGQLADTYGITTAVIATALGLYVLGILTLPFAPETKGKALPA
ncbi:MAG TPA: MFS transporter, partial [Fimbriimonadaceae bacterium]|nr:MFS transporter [Fimbriimonadaceae bacterium]